jgi:APA family basic amino acid/polyamine antiporter
MSSNSIARRGRRPGDLRVVVRRGTKLPRTLGAPALFAACYGNVGSSIYYALGVTAAFALGLTPLALILAGAIFVTTALNYAEGTAALPHAGGSSSFARRAFNEPIGFLVGWVQLLNYTATVSISAYFAISYLGIFGKYLPLIDHLREDQWHVAATVVLICLLIALNVVGIQESSVLNLVLAFTDLVTQFVLVILGIVLLLNIRTVLNNIHLGLAPTWGNFLASVSIAMVSYTGIETISNLSEEAKNPGRAVPLATFWVIAAVLFVSAFLPTIGMSVFPVHFVHGMFTTDLATTYKADPVSGIVTVGFMKVFQPLAFWAGIWVGILAFTILVIATNAGLIGISRLSYSMAGADLLPRQFATLHPKFKTPYVSIVVFGLAAALLVMPGILVGSSEIDLMSAVYSLAATFAFCSAHLSVMLPSGPSSRSLCFKTSPTRRSSTSAGWPLGWPASSRIGSIADGRCGSRWNLLHHPTARLSASRQNRFRMRRAIGWAAASESRRTRPLRSRFEPIHAGEAGAWAGSSTSRGTATYVER